jgi:hypothetical protein
MSRSKIDIGQRFNMLTVLEEAPMGKSGRIFKCQCDCGVIKNICLPLLKRPTNKSCGCYRQANKTKHGLWQSREYSTWENMIQRCTNKNNIKYHLYGERGITICESWLKSFKHFYDDMGPRPDNTTLDRIDGDKGYYKANCKWSNPREQMVNVRYYHQNVKYGDIIQPIEEWIRQLNIDREKFKTRLLRGLGFKETLFNTFDIIVYNVTERKQTVWNFQDFINQTKLDQNKVIELLDDNHEIPYENYILRYLTGFTTWPENIFRLS